MHFTIEDLLAEGDRVAARVTFRGTHQGNQMCIPDTGKQIHVTGISIFCIANGQCVEFWTDSGDPGLMQQLGVVPAPGQLIPCLATSDSEKIEPPSSSS